MPPVSSSLGRFNFVSGEHGQPPGTNGIRVRILCLFRSDSSLRWLDVCICLDASEKGFAFAVREGCRELRKLVVSRNGTKFERRSRSIRARSHALRCVAPDVG